MLPDWEILKILGDKFYFKMAQIFGEFLGHFKNRTFKVKSAVAVFGQRLAAIGLLFSLSSGRTGV